MIIGFILGNAILTYITNGNTSTIIYFREIFIASIILLFIPNKFKLEVEDLIGKNTLLDNVPETRLSSGNKVIDKINAISDSINDLTNKINEEEEQNLSDIDNFVEDFLDNLQEAEDNIFYDELNENDEIIKQMYNQIVKKDILIENDLIEIFKSRNNYILVKDEKIKNDLQEIIKIVNRTYKMEQIRNIRIEEKKKATVKLKNELDSMKKIISKATNISKNKFSNFEKEILTLLKNKSYPVKMVEIKEISNGKKIVNISFEKEYKQIKQNDRIKNISDLISRLIGSKLCFEKDITHQDTEEYIQTYVSNDVFDIKVGSTKISKDDSITSGDCSLQMKLEDGKYFFVISDRKRNWKECKKYKQNSN